MMAFKPLAMESAPMPPPATMVLSPDAFHALWKRRPETAVTVGLRPLAMVDIRFARAEGYRKAIGAHPDEGDVLNRVDAFNDWVMMLAVSRGTCDAADMRKSWSHWLGAAELNVDAMLTREAVKALYDAIERVQLSCSPVQAKIGPEGFDELVGLVPLMAERMPGARFARLQRLLGFVLEECRLYTTPEETRASDVARSAAE